MPELCLDDTIAAIATPPGEGGIAIIRVSGCLALETTARVFRSPGKSPVASLASHTLHLGIIQDPEGHPVDQVLLSVFRAPRSYTGEDTAEISAHGGLAVTRRILELLIQAGARMAEPGEFTRRAFLNGKLDLLQAEAVVDLIRAGSEKSREVSLRQLEGQLSRKLAAIKNDLMKIYAHMEAFLDFPEDDLEIYSDEAFTARLDQGIEDISLLVASFKRGSLLREGARCVIAGRPNVGKSSLFNTLLERDRAIVSEHAGTTRDMLEEPLEIEGMPVRLVDTAGLGPEAEHPLEREGMGRTRRVLAEADVVLFVVDGSAPLHPADESVFRELRADQMRLVVVNKADLPSVLSAEAIRTLTGSAEFIAVSSRTSQGLDHLEKALAGLLTAGAAPESEQITRLRHKKALEAALESLIKATADFRARQALEIVTLDVKAALDQMRELIGEVYSEDLLDVIFSEFCIGK